MHCHARMVLRLGVALVVVAGLTGCAGGAGGDGTATGGSASQTASSSSEDTFGTPTTEDTVPTTGTSGSASTTPIVSLASLPIGGASAPDPNDPHRQCVGISWVVTTDARPEIPAGYAVEVTGALFSAKGYAVIPTGCGAGSPNCLHYILRIGKDTCDLAVRTLPSARPDAGATVGLKGILYCPNSVGVARCNQFAAAVAKEPGVTIELIEPTGDATSGTTGTPTSGGG